MDKLKTKIKQAEEDVKKGESKKDIIKLKESIEKLEKELYDQVKMIGIINIKMLKKMAKVKNK